MLVMTACYGRSVDRKCSCWKEKERQATMKLEKKVGQLGWEFGRLSDGQLGWEFGRLSDGQRGQLSQVSLQQRHGGLIWGLLPGAVGP